MSIILIKNDLLVSLHFYVNECIIFIYDFHMSPHSFKYVAGFGQRATNWCPDDKATNQRA